MARRTKNPGRQAPLSAAAPPSEQQQRWPFAAVAAAAFVAYANALGHPFLFDDDGAIVGNQTIRSLAASIMGGPAQSSAAGRPLVNLSFAMNYLVNGVAPWGYQFANLLVHVGCGLLLFAVVRRLLALPRIAAWTGGRESGMAAAVALIWVVHPLTSEIVDYATQRSEALMALFFLGTLYAGIRALGSRRAAAWQAASVAACAAGMACKESMVVAPVVMLLADATFTGTGLVGAFRKRPVYYLGLFATWVLLALLIVEGPRWRSAGFASGVSPWNYLLEQAPMLVRYLRLVFLPTGLVLDYGLPSSTTFGAVLPSALVVLALLAATIGTWFTAPVVGFFGLWFFLALAPTSSFLPIATELGAERRMYVPLMAVLCLLVLGATRLLERLEDLRMRTRVATVGTALLCVLLATATFLRNREYDSGLGLWQTVVERWPQGRAHYNYGLELKAAGRRAEAMEEYARALPEAPEAHYALGFELQADSRYGDALEHYQAFVRLKPEDINVPRTYHQIGRTLLALGRREEAVQAFKDTLARKAGDIDALGGLGDTLLALERLPEAVDAYQEYMRRKPDNPSVLMNMGIALVKLDRDAEARDVFARLVVLEPSNVAAHMDLAYALANTGRSGESVQEFRRALALETDPAARADIEQAMATLLGGH